jgi:transcriptional regulator with XRE-family HTH domain
MAERFLTHWAVQYSVRRLRQELGLTLRQLAQIAQVKAPTVSQIELGQNTNPRVHTVLKLARALNVTVDELLTWDERDGVRPEEKRRKDSAEVSQAAHRCRHLVARPLGNELSLELGKRQQHVQDQPTHRCAAMKVLCHTNERHLVLLERFH